MTKYITRGAKPKAEEQKRGEKTEYDGKERERERNGAFKKENGNDGRKSSESQSVVRKATRERESVSKIFFLERRWFRSAFLCLPPLSSERDLIPDFKV